MKFGNLMCSKAMKILFLARIIRHKLCMIYAIFYFFVQKAFLTKNYFLAAEMNLTTQGPLYIYLIFSEILPFLDKKTIREKICKMLGKKEKFRNLPVLHIWSKFFVSSSIFEGEDLYYIIFRKS